jgi:hypothetical protein
MLPLGVKLILPNKKRFAFSIVDDTDLATVANVSPVYECLVTSGLRTTKTVWTIAPAEPIRIGGATLDDPGYLNFILRLKAQGFEIASHGASSHGVTRVDNARALSLFQQRIGHYPTLHCNHYINRDGLYWGRARLSCFSHRLLYDLANFRKDRRFEGHVVTSPFFWGDLAQQHFRYVRNFVFDDINLLHAPGNVLYYDADRPLVNGWFTSTRAPDLKSFLTAVSDVNQQRLEDEGGVCIIYTHFGSGFVTNGILHPAAQRLIQQLGARPGWFVPATELLDYLGTQGFGQSISRSQRTAMERRWLFNKLSSRIVRRK